ncbi:MAG: PEGA domain-containing protein [Planctomycetota bacterium]|nr:PEGA domain-containing protein [Planctomycetota bacterium]
MIINYSVVLIRLFVATLTGRIICGLVIVGSLCLLIGCAEHRIIITSEPPGANVSIDSKERGLTPLSVPFTFYGNREVAIEREGYQTHKSIISVKPPIFQVFPFDILMLLIPYPFIDTHTYYFILEKQKGKTDIKKALERMERLKEHLEERIKEENPTTTR